MDSRVCLAHYPFVVVRIAAGLRSRRGLAPAEAGERENATKRQVFAIRSTSGTPSAKKGPLRNHFGEDQ
jgi:hypothetical protein